MNAAIDKAVVFRYFYNEPITASNRYTKAAAKDPKQYVGFAWINPYSEAVAGELRTALTKWHLKRREAAP